MAEGVAPDPAPKEPKAPPAPKEPKTPKQDPKPKQNPLIKQGMGMLPSGDAGSGLLLIILGLGVGYATLAGLWPLILLALFYPERLANK